MSLYRCVKCGNVDHLQITYPNGTHLLADGKHVKPLCTICLGKSWHNKMRMEKYDPQWHVVINPLNGQRKHEYEIRVGLFLAPGMWAGYYNRKSGTQAEDIGSVDNEAFNDLVVRDLNAPSKANQDRLPSITPIENYFQFGLFSRTTYDRIVSVDIEGLGSFLRAAGVLGGGVDRHFFTDGHTNIWEWMSKQKGKTLKITIWETPAVKQNG